MDSKYTKKQQEILEITINYISKNGMQAFSLRNIAEEIGIKQPTLYGHFQSKEEILRGVFDIYKTSITTYQSSLIKLKISKLTKIRMYFKKMCEFIQYKPDYMNLVWFEMYQHRDIFKEDLTFILENMLKISESGKQDENIKDGTDYKWITNMLHGVMHVYLKQKLLSKDFDVLKNADECWENLEKLLKT